VLLFAEEADPRELMSRLLRSAGARARQASSAEAALLAAGFQRHVGNSAPAQSLLQALAELHAARKDWCTFAVGGD